MRRLLCGALVLLITMVIQAQTTETVTSYYSDEFKDFERKMPVVREICGGTKFIVSYEGDWSNEMIGAFEYACKIWEENLPTTLPIKIKAIMTLMPLKQQKVLSKVTHSTYPWGRLGVQMVSGSQIKAALLMEYNRNNIVQFEDSLSKDFFKHPDIVLEYNLGLRNQFSYSLDTTDAEKYDFITVVLRDIARGLGVLWPIVPFKTGENGKMLIDRGTLAAYPTLIANAIQGSTQEETFQNATGGTVDVNIPNYGSVKLYAPSTWQPGVSLNTFVPDESKGLTCLLSHEFGKGTRIRNITDKYDPFFWWAMDWRPEIATGMTSVSVFDGGCSTADVIPYKGKVKMDKSRAKMQRIYIPESPSPMTRSVTSSDDDEYFDIYDYCAPYGVRLRADGSVGDGWSFALLKKDGTWDIVSEQAAPATWWEVDLSTVDFHYDDSEYARTCDGYLRGRMAYWVQLDAHYWEGFSRYYVLDYLPQIVNVHEPNYIDRQETINYRRLKMGMRDLEGTDRIVVEQWEEGEDVPYKYDLPNYKDGLFEVKVDSRFDNEFRFIAYNKNGSVKGESIKVKKTVFTKYEVDFDFDNIKIGFDPIVDPDGKLLRKLKNHVSYEIVPLTSQSGGPSISGKGETIPLQVNISDLPAGTYTLNIYTENNQRQSFKFIKK